MPQKNIPQKTKTTSEVTTGNSKEAPDATQRTRGPLVQESVSSLRKNPDAIVSKLKEFISFESISTDPAFNEQLFKCYEWLKAEVESMGFDCQTWCEGTHPILFAKYTVDPSLPTWLFYQHYDVQPADPLEAWDHPPFVPYIDDNGTIFARGAQDNKGQCTSTLAALSAYLADHGTFPFNIHLIIEGQEESGSGNLASILEEKRADLACEGLIVVDSTMPSLERPAVTLGTRGVLSMDLTITEGRSDLHSGLHGNLAYNPNRALSELIASFYDREGRIRVEGFYDGIEPISDEELAELDMHFDREEYYRDFGMYPEGGWRAHSPLQRLWLDPTLEVNGMSGGYTGHGFKSVIPAQAHAKISCRSVPGQDPDNLVKLISHHIKQHLPSSLTFSLKRHEGGGRAAFTSTSSPVANIFEKAITRQLGRSCSKVLIGASFPVIADLAAVSGGDFIGVGYGLGTDNIHAPNENWSVERLIGLAEAIYFALEERKQLL